MKSKSVKKSEYYIILHNIRSEFNVGSIFRTADAAGISKIYITGYSPAPVDRFGQEVKGVSKVALGAEKNIPWEYRKSIAPVVKDLKNKNFQIIAVEQDAGAIDYKKIKISPKAAFIFGNEVGGISKSVLKKADIVAEIPMRGKKESLNVSVSAGVAIFRILGI